MAPEYTDDEKPDYVEVTMPDLTDMSIADAIVALKKAGLDYEFAGESGKVIYQFPVAGQKVRSNQIVYFSTE